MTSLPNQLLLPLVRKLESIANLSNEEQLAVASLPVVVKAVQARHDIVHDNDKPLQCCLILEGWACRYKLMSGGRRQIFSFHVAGDFVDLQSLHISVMDHSISTLTKTTLAFISHESLRSLTSRFPRIAAVLWRDTLIDGGISRACVMGLGRRTAYEHVAHLFCELYCRQEAVGLAGNHRCPFPITQSELADALGLSNVHVNRVLQDMRGNGLITLRRNTLEIAAWNELIQAAEFDPTYLHLSKRDEP